MTQPGRRGSTCHMVDRIGDARDTTWSVKRRQSRRGACASARGDVCAPPAAHILLLPSLQIRQDKGRHRSTRDRFEGEGNGPWGRAAGSSVLLLLLCTWAFACGLQCCVVRPRARAHARFRAVMFLSVYIYVALARLRSRATSHRRTRATCVLCLRLPCDGVYLPCSLRGCGRACVFVRAARMAFGRSLWAD